MIIIEQPIEIFNLIHMYEVMCTKNDFILDVFYKMIHCIFTYRREFAEDTQGIIFGIERLHIRCSKKFFDHL